MNSAKNNFIQRFLVFYIPGVFQVLITFVVLPISTLVLSPHDVGIFALVSTFTSVGLVICTFANNFILSEHYPSLDYAQKQQLVGSVIWISLSLGVIVSIILLSSWSLIAQLNDKLTHIPISMMWIAVATMMLGIPWVVSNDVLTLKENPRVYAFVIILQLTANNGVVLLCLFVWKLGYFSLFYGALSSALIGFTASFFVIGKAYCYIPTKIWRKKVLYYTGYPLLSAVTENFQQVVVNYLLARYQGLAVVGLYSHAAGYRNILSLLIKSVTRAIWPTTLQEAKSDNANFIETMRAWGLAYYFLFVAGVFFILFGPNIVGLLTHNKFVFSADIAVFLIIGLFFQVSARPQVGVFFAYGKGREYSFLSLFSFIFCILVAILATPYAGVWGVVGAVIAQQIFFKFSLAYSCSKIKKIGNYDTIVWVLSGVLVVIYLYNKHHPLSLIDKWALLLILAIFFMIKIYFGLVDIGAKKGDA